MVYIDVQNLCVKTRKTIEKDWQCTSIHVNRADKNNRKGLLALHVNFRHLGLHFLDASSHSKYIWSSLLELTELEPLSYTIY